MNEAADAQILQDLVHVGVRVKSAASYLELFDSLELFGVPSGGLSGSVSDDVFKAAAAENGDEFEVDVREPVD